MFVSIDFLGPKEMILSIAQYLSKYLVRLYRLFPMLFLFNEMRKKGQILFFTKKIAFFSKICVFNNLLGLKKMLQ